MAQLGNTVVNGALRVLGGINTNTLATGNITSTSINTSGTVTANQFVGTPILPVNPTTKPTTVGAIQIET